MMYESDYDRKYDNEFDCGPPPNFNIPPPPRADFVELYKCSENAMNDYGLCGAITVSINIAPLRLTLLPNENIDINGVCVVFCVCTISSNILGYIQY